MTSGSLPTSGPPLISMPGATVPPDRRLVLRLPGRWLHLDPARPRVTDARIRAFAQDTVGRADDLAAARADLRKALGAMLKRADGPSALESTFVCHQIAPGVNTPLSVCVFAPALVHMSPVLGHHPAAVIAGFIDAMEVIDDTQEWRRLACVDGWAASRWHVTTQELAPALADQALPVFTAEYWRTVPGSKRLMLITVTSPLAVIPRTMLRLADAMVAGSRFTATPGRGQDPRE